MLFGIGLILNYYTQCKMNAFGYPILLLYLLAAAYENGGQPQMRLKKNQGRLITGHPKEPIKNSFKMLVAKIVHALVMRDLHPT